MGLNTSGGVHRQRWLLVDRWGLRGDEPPEDWEAADTIVAIGGSTTLCLELDDRRTWPHLLQERLRGDGGNVWVGNAGQDGHSTWGT